MIRARPAIVSKGLGRDAAARGTGGIPGFEIPREFAGLTKYVSLVREAGQGAVCG